MSRWTVDRNELEKKINKLEENKGVKLESRTVNFNAELKKRAKRFPKISWEDILSTR